MVNIAGFVFQQGEEGALAMVLAVPVQNHKAHASSNYGGSNGYQKYRVVWAEAGGNCVL